MEANKVGENEVLDSGEIVEGIPFSPSFLCGVVGRRK
jgi:hypothetical protein